MTIDVRRIRADEALALREIRLAALSDAPEAFSTTFAEMVDEPVAFWWDRVTSNSAGDEAATFVAEDDGGNLVGMVAGYHPDTSRRSVELVSMWVAPTARSAGLGARLVEAVVTWADDIGATAVELWVMRDNGSAADLYRRCGFAVVDNPVAAPDDPCRNEIRMRRPLA